MTRKITIIGGGWVGGAMSNLCEKDQPLVYDPNLFPEVSREEANEGDIAFIAVPTPLSDNGSCDTSIVEEVVSWLEVPLMVIRSTIKPGTTERLAHKYNRRIVFQPEYLGETTGHRLLDMSERTFVILGGEKKDTAEVADFYRNYYNSYVKFFFTDSRTAEVTKYMENAFFAVKVTFVNEFYDIAKAHGISFDELRELWLADERVSRDHTFVYPDNRGFSGKCLPKDCNAIVKAAERLGCVPQLMKSVLKINEDFLSGNADSG